MANLFHLFQLYQGIVKYSFSATAEMLVRNMLSIGNNQQLLPYSSRLLDGIIPLVRGSSIIHSKMLEAPALPEIFNNAARRRSVTHRH
jgi:hypothetical protein